MQKKLFKPRYNQNINVTIQSIGLNGEGIGYWHGYTLFVDGALPEEVIRGRIIESHKRFGRVRVDAIENPSPARVTPPCPHFGECGGCHLMHMSYEGQLAFKRKRVQDAFHRFGNLAAVEIENCHPSSATLGYRNKIQLPIALGPEGTRLGLYARHSHDLVAIQTCYLHYPLGEETFQRVAHILRTSAIAPYDPVTESGVLRYLLIKTAASTQQALVVLIVYGETSPRLQQVAEEILAACPQVKGVVLNTNSTPGNTVLGECYQTLVGVDSIEEVILGKVFKLSAASFFQVNTAQAENIYRAAIERAHLQASDRVLDAYCGIGTLTLSLASFVQQVIGVECVPEAIENAWDNAERNQVANVEFVCANTEEFIGTLDHIDVVFLNPPRKGCEAAVLARLGELKPRTIVYISCDPATLARDLSILCHQGYQLDQVTPFDMFPQTSHVETLATLRCTFSRSAFASG